MKTVLKEHMSKDLVTVNAEAQLSEAYGLMRENRIRHLPVIDRGGVVVGIISDRDLQRAMKSEVLGQGEFKMEKLEFDPNDMVADYMNWPVRTFDKETELKAVTQKMIEEKVSSFLVSDSGRIVGIITTEDLLKVLFKLLSQDHNLKLDLETLLYNPAFQGLTKTISDSGI